MKTLIIGMGALGGLIAARLRGAGLAVWLATRDAEQADRLRASGLRVTGMGGSVTVQATAIAPLDAYGADDKFELVLLATKAHDAIEVAPKLSVPIGNSDLSEMMEVAASPQFSFDARSANLDHSFAVWLPLASRCGTRKSGPPPPGQRLEALCETSAEADAGRPSVVAHPIASLE